MERGGEERKSRWMMQACIFASLLLVESFAINCGFIHDRMKSDPPERVYDRCALEGRAFRNR